MVALLGAQIRVGDRIEHAVFGNGQVISWRWRDHDALLGVRWDSGEQSAINYPNYAILRING